MREPNLSSRLALSDSPSDSSENIGELTIETLSRCLDFADRAERLCLVSGSPAMVTSVEKSLRALRIPKRNIIAEHFKFAWPRDPSRKLR
ncbi:MAG: hypothetical protein ACLPNY_08050 [Roseiarcus sp.]